MKVSGFTICRNSVKLGFPFRESLLSLAPLCDEIVVAHDDQNDGTREALEELRKQIKCELRIIPSHWDLNNLKGGQELSVQTNVALEACAHEVVFYLQSDEVLHEDDYETIRSDLALMAKSDKVASLSLAWIHFYGDFQSIVKSRKWYRREIRAFKKSSGLKSFLDAQGFRKPDGSKNIRLPTLLSTARVFHYGYVRPADLMAMKSNDLKKAWTGEDPNATAQNIYKQQYGIRAFTQTHPKVMQGYLNQLPTDLPKAYNVLAPKKITLKTVRLFLSDIIEKFSDLRLGEFKNYSKIYSSKDLK